MKNMVIDILDYLGVSPKYVGYAYLIDGCVIACNLLKSSNKLSMKVIYNMLAIKYHTRDICVEKNARVCIEGVFKNGIIKHINSIFENISTYYDDRPSNKLLFITIVNYLNRSK